MPRKALTFDTVRAMGLFALCLCASVAMFVISRRYFATTAPVSNRIVPSRLLRMKT